MIDALPVAAILSPMLPDQPRPDRSSPPWMVEVSGQVDLADGIAGRDIPDGGGAHRTSRALESRAGRTVTALVRGSGGDEGPVGDGRAAGEGGPCGWSPSPAYGSDVENLEIEIAAVIGLPAPALRAQSVRARPRPLRR